MVAGSELDDSVSRSVNLEAADKPALCIATVGDLDQLRFLPGLPKQAILATLPP